MAAAVGLRGDNSAGALRAAAKRSKDGAQTRRLLALAAIYDGATRTEAAKIGGVTLQVVRDWVVRFNAQGPDGLIADEARIGQKNKIARRWAKRGSRPSAPSDQRTASAYIFGAICPKEGKGAALIMPRCHTEAMNLHLAEIATQVAPHAHAAILLDQAGWHLSGGLKIPSNVTLIPLPAKCPELNPQENIWQFIRDNWLSNRIFKSYDDIVDHCCRAWNNLIDQPWRTCPSACAIGPTSSNHRVLV